MRHNVLVRCFIVVWLVSCWGNLGAVNIHVSVKTVGSTAEIVTAAGRGIFVLLANLAEQNKWGKATQLRITADVARVINEWLILVNHPDDGLRAWVYEGGWLGYDILQLLRHSGGEVTPSISDVDQTTWDTADTTLYLIALVVHNYILPITEGAIAAAVGFDFCNSKLRVRLQSLNSLNRMIQFYLEHRYDAEYKKYLAFCLAHVLVTLVEWIHDVSFYKSKANVVSIKNHSDTSVFVGSSSSVLSGQSNSAITVPVIPVVVAKKDDNVVVPVVKSIVNNDKKPLNTIELDEKPPLSDILITIPTQLVDIVGEETNSDYVRIENVVFQHEQKQAEENPPPSDIPITVISDEKNVVVIENKHESAETTELITDSTTAFCGGSVATNRSVPAVPPSALRRLFRWLCCCRKGR